MVAVADGLVGGSGAIGLGGGQEDQQHVETHVEEDRQGELVKVAVNLGA